MGSAVGKKGLEIKAANAMSKLDRPLHFVSSLSGLMPTCKVDIIVIHKHQSHGHDEEGDAEEIQNVPVLPQEPQAARLPQIEAAGKCACEPL
jgi:hypothetical protein